MDMEHLLLCLTEAARLDPTSFSTGEKGNWIPFEHQKSFVGDQGTYMDKSHVGWMLW